MQALTERFEMRLDQDALQAVDAWRSKQPDLPSRAEAIRRLVEQGLTSLAPRERPELRFSPGETLLIHMLCDLFKAQKVKGETDPKFIEDALYGGHLWALEWKLPGIFHHHIDGASVVSEVVNILEMWDFIELGYEKLSRKDKGRVEKEAEPFGKNPEFRGFDGNNETEHLGVAQFLIHRMERFSRFKDRELNSHWPTVESYHRMLAVFLPMRKNLHGIGLDAGQIVDILNARTHPEQRKKGDAKS